MTENAYVISADKNTALVKITFSKKDGCSSCGACGRTGGEKTLKLRVNNAVGAKSGDRVKVNFSTCGSANAALLSYLIPLSFAAAGLFIGKSLGGELLMFSLFAAGLCLSFGALKLINAALSKKSGHSPEITEIIEPKV